MVAESIRASWIKVPQRGVTLWHEFDSLRYLEKSERLWENPSLCEILAVPSGGQNTEINTLFGKKNKMRLGI